MYDPGVAAVTADPGQLRVLRYDDDPASQEWVDVVAADPAVYVEGRSFREADSRDAPDDEPAERRRLFDAVDPGRTLLVEIDCGACTEVAALDTGSNGDGSNETGSDETGSDGNGDDDRPGPVLHVWDLRVGDADDDSPFSDGTDVVVAGDDEIVAVGDLFAVVGDACCDPLRSVVSASAANDGSPVIELLARHEPTDGAALYVLVFRAVEVGAAEISADGAITTILVR